MSMSANLHGAIRAASHQVDGTSWLTIYSDDDNCHISVFMPYTTAVAMADAFNNPGRMKQLTDFIAEFAEYKFDAISSPGFVAPEDVEDDVTDLGPVEAWQSDAADLLKVEPKDATS